jgi:hypothetical protein
MGALAELLPAAQAIAAEEPPTVPRGEWGADLYAPASSEAPWRPEFHPIRKVILHHTHTPNDDADPAATVRSIHRFHALERGWGDIGYNLLVDEAGRVYEGRAAGGSLQAPPGQNAAGLGVTGAHVRGRNAGTVGIALLGTFDEETPSACALHTTAWLIATLLATRGIDPEAADDYVNPVSGERARFPNVAGHRDLANTPCPGDGLQAALPDLRRRPTGRT